MKSAGLPIVALLFHAFGRASGFASPAPGANRKLRPGRPAVAGLGVRPCVGFSTRPRNRASAPGEHLFHPVRRTSATTTSLSEEVEANDPEPNARDETPFAAGLASFARSASQVKEFLSSKRGALAATAILVFALVFSPLGALAVQSGGRMGGGSFSSGGSSRSSSSSYSRPSTGGYSTGYSRGFRSGVSTGYYSRPSVVVSPSPWFSPWSYNPWGWGYARPGVVVSTGPGLFGFLVFGGFALAAVAAISSFGSSVADSASSFSTTSTGSALGDGVSVVQLSVALDVPNRESSGSILTVLSRLAETARTDSRVGIQNLTSQVALELLRRKQSIVAASSKYDHYRNVDKAQREFNNLAVQERGKFERETISKYKGVDYSEGGRPLKPGQFAPQATMAVVTILLAIEGDSTRVSRIGSIGDVEEALSRIAADSKVDDCLQTAEILWTPTEPTETLTRREVFADYPKLRSV